MTITPSYIPGPNQTDAVALARATALGVTVAPRIVPPVYAPFVTTLPGVVAEYGGGPTVVYHADDGTLTAQQITNAIAGLEAQQTADGVAQTNQSTTLTQLQADLATIHTWLTNNPNGAVLTAAQTRVLARMLGNLTQYAIGQSSTAPVTT